MLFVNDLTSVWCLKLVTLPFCRRCLLLLMLSRPHKTMILPSTLFTKRFEAFWEYSVVEQMLFVSSKVYSGRSKTFIFFYSLISALHYCESCSLFTTGWFISYMESIYWQQKSLFNKTPCKFNYIVKWLMVDVMMMRIILWALHANWGNMVLPDQKTVIFWLIDHLWYFSDKFAFILLLNNLNVCNYNLKYFIDLILEWLYIILL